MILLQKVTAEGLDEPLDLEVPTGTSAAVITAREIDSKIIVRLLLGFQAPLSGRITLSGVDPMTLKDPALVSYRRGIGMLYHDGGLISNLNVWENLILQGEYFGAVSSRDLEKNGKDVLQMLGYQGSLALLPSSLSLFERRIIGLARCLLAEPDIMIYQAVVEGLSRGEQKQLCGHIRTCHNQVARRTSLFITSSSESLKGLEFDVVHSV